MPATFITARAQHLVALSALVEERREETGARFVHLMEHPKDRVPGIAVQAVGYMMERYAEESGDDEAARGYAADLCNLAVQPFGAISKIPLPKRGDIHSTGAALVSAICWRQAMMEIVAVDALQVGTEMGVLNKAAAGRMSTVQKKTMAREGGLKKTIAQLGAPVKGAK